MWFWQGGGGSGRRSLSAACQSPNAEVSQSWVWHCWIHPQPPPPPPRPPAGSRVSSDMVSSNGMDWWLGGGRGQWRIWGGGGVGGLNPPQRFFCQYMKIPADLDPKPPWRIPAQNPPPPPRRIPGCLYDDFQRTVVNPLIPLSFIILVWVCVCFVWGSHVLLNVKYQG